MIISERLKGCNLILASGSPRRSALMRECGLQFTVADKYSVEEKFPANMSPVEAPAYLAELKSDAYPHRLGENDILITADTIVVLDGQVLGKPDDADDAKHMLARLSGKRHTVVSGVMLRGASRREVFVCHTVVRFAHLTQEQIDYYVDNFRPLDKAGSYAIQEWIGCVGIESIEGSFYNVMGLPTQQLCEALEKFVSE